MADISKITLPNSQSYNLKDRSQTVSEHKHYLSHVSPISQKTLTGVIATSNDAAGGNFYYGKITPSNWSDIWQIKYTIFAYVPNNLAYSQKADVMITGYRDTMRLYSSMNSINTYVVYSNLLYRLKEAGFNNNYGHALGIRLYSSNYPTNSSYKRTVEIKIYETKNCTFDFYEGQNAYYTYANIPGTGTTNYSGLSQLNFTSNGLQETGDVNDLNYQNRIYYGSAWKTYAPLYRYQILLQKSENELLPINSVNNTTGTSKTLTTESFNPFGEIFYYNTTTNYATAGATIASNAVLYKQIHSLDLRYSFNKGSTLTTWKRVYIVAQLQQDGSAKLASSPIVQDLPITDDGYIYILLGSAISTTNIELYQNHPVYRFKNGKLQVLTEQMQTEDNYWKYNSANDCIELVFPN